MHPFKAFVVEKKVYELSPSENKQVEDAYQAYLNYFGPDVLGNHDPREVYKNAIKDNRIYLHTIEYFDHSTKENNKVDVYVSFDRYAADAAYEESQDVIEIYYYNYSHLSSLVQKNKIAHELFHAKQHYKTITPGYRKAVYRRTGANTAIRSERGYFFAPNEYPVQIASIIHEMDRQYRMILKKAKSGSNIKFWDHQRKGFLRVLEQFIRGTKFEEDKLPNYLQNEKRFIQALFRNKNNPKYAKYYKDFKQKMYWYFQNLKKLKSYDREADNNL
jgi:hypothetical protein